MNMEMLKKDEEIKILVNKDLPETSKCFTVLKDPNLEKVREV